MKQANLFFGLFGIVLITLFAVAYFRHGSGAPQSAGSSSQESSSTLTYTNGTYGFSLTHPKALTLSDSFTPFHRLGTLWRTGTDEAEMGTPLFQVDTYKVDQAIPEGNPYPLFYLITVRGSVSTDTKGCFTIHDTSTKLHGTTTLSGREWSVFTYEDASMLQFVKSTSYRTVYRDTCYVLEQIAAGSTYKDESMRGGKTDKELQTLFEKSFDIIKTFTFN